MKKIEMRYSAENDIKKRYKNDIKNDIKKII